MSARPPREVSDWIKVFESSALYRHSYAQMFEDWVELCICCFANRTMEERYLEIAKRYDRDELDVMARLMGQLILIHEDQSQGRGWYDALGSIYEYLTSRQKSSRMGQFFTPIELCDLMAQLTAGDVEEEEPSASDPACGSGRLLLAIHAKKKRTLAIAADVDPVCAKMCALNFWLHGVKGEVACMNSLTLQWHFAYQTHPRLLWPFITFLGEDRKEQSLTWIDAESIRAGSKPKAAPDLFSQVEDPVATYRRQRRQFKDSLLFVRDVDSYVTLYRDAEQVAALLEKSYDGVSPLRVAPPLFDELAFNLVKNGHSVAVLFTPEALDRNAARQVDLYDLLQNEQPDNDGRNNDGAIAGTVHGAGPRDHRNERLAPAQHAKAHARGKKGRDRAAAQEGAAPRRSPSRKHSRSSQLRRRNLSPVAMDPKQNADLSLATEREHTIRVRYANGTHQAVDDRSWVKCTSTSGHEQAAFNLLRKQGITDAQLQRLHQREQAMRDPKRVAHEQWRVYKVVRNTK